MLTSFSIHYVIAMYVATYVVPYYYGMFEQYRILITLCQINSDIQLQSENL